MLHPLQGSDSVYFDSGILERWFTFGFKRGGTIDLTMALESPGLLPSPHQGAYAWAAICDADQLDQVLAVEGEYGTTGLCWPYRSVFWSNVSIIASCFQSFQLSNATNASTSWRIDSLSVPYDGFFSFIVMVCVNPPHHPHLPSTAEQHQQAATSADSNLLLPPPHVTYGERRLAHRQSQPLLKKVPFTATPQHYQEQRSRNGGVVVAMPQFGPPPPPPAGVSIDITYTLLNPGGEQLSTSQIPLKWETLVALVAWGLAAMYISGGCALVKLTAPPPSPFPSYAAYVDFIRQYGRWALSPVRPLHLLLVMLTLLWGAAAGASWRYWTTMSSSGQENPAFAILVTVLNSASSSLLLALLLLVSQGWQVTRLGLLTSELRQSGVLVALYVTAWLLYQLVNGVVPLALLLLVYVLCLRYVLAASTGTLGLLKTLATYTTALINVGGARRPANSGSSTASSEQQPFQSAETTPLSPSASAANRYQPLLEAEEAEGGEGTEHSDGQAAHNNDDHGSGREHSGWRAILFGGRRHGNSSSSRGPVRPQSPRQQRRHGSHRQGRPSLTERQIVTLERFRCFGGAYLLLHVAAALWGDLALTGSEYEYAGYGLSQSLSVALIAYLLVLFRPRRRLGHGPLFDPRGYAALEGGEPTAAAGAGGARGNGSGGLLAALGRLWEGEGAYYSLSGGGGEGRGAQDEACGADPSFAGGSSGSDNIIIVHPDSVDDATGAIIGPVAMAVAVPTLPVVAHPDGYQLQGDGAGYTPPHATIGPGGTGLIPISSSSGR